MELGKNMGRYRFVPLEFFVGFCKFYKLRKEEESAKGRQKRKNRRKGFKKQNDLNEQKCSNFGVVK